MSLVTGKTYVRTTSQELLQQRGVETVGGLVSSEHTGVSEPVVWTIQGNWYRQSDGRAIRKLTEGRIAFYPQPNWRDLSLEEAHPG
jgi:hypothetical protein